MRHFNQSIAFWGCDTDKWGSLIDLQRLSLKDENIFLLAAAVAALSIAVASDPVPSATPLPPPPPSPPPANPVETAVEEADVKRERVEGEGREEERKRVSTLFLSVACDSTVKAQMRGSVRRTTSHQLLRTVVSI